MSLRAKYGFHATPFTREIPVEHRFELPQFTAAKDGLLGVVQRRMSGALIAPAGTGKSGLLRDVIAALPEARYRTHYVKVSGLSKRDTCREIAHVMGLQPTGAYNALVRRVQERALEVSDSDGLRPVLVLDEAQDLRPDVLSMLAPLTNFDMDSRLVLSVILAGQPPLATMLRRSELEGVARRLAHYATLRPLSREETAAYVAHRCTVAGATTNPFDQGAGDAIYEIGRGNLRATDRLALKALEQAAAKDAGAVDHVDVIDARRLLWP